MTTAHIPRGKFITFEGGEGAGKSTQAGLLKDYLEQQGIKVLLTREPGGTEGAEAIRGLLVSGEAGRWLPETELLLHLAARKDHVERSILPALAAGTWVVCDRFMDSTLAYQGYGHGLGRGYVEEVARLVLGSLAPDRTFFLDVPPGKGLKRTGKRSGKEARYESMGEGFHQRVYEGFRALAKAYPERITRISATGGVKAVQKEIMRGVKGLLP